MNSTQLYICCILGKVTNLLHTHLHTNTKLRIYYIHTCVCGSSQIKYYIEMGFFSSYTFDFETKKKIKSKHYQPNILGMRENTQYAHKFSKKFRESHNTRIFAGKTGTFYWCLVWSWYCAEYYGFNFHFHSSYSMFLQSWSYIVGYMLLVATEIIWCL